VRVFYISTGLTVNLIGLRITKGNSSSGSGGGILNGGTLTVTECTIFDNHTRMYGGGISNSGLLEVRDSTIREIPQPVFMAAGIYNIGTLVRSMVLWRTTWLSPGAEALPTPDRSTLTIVR
jgi:hypothetical protein